MPLQLEDDSDDGIQIPHLKRSAIRRRRAELSSSSSSDDDEDDEEKRRRRKKRERERERERKERERKRRRRLPLLPAGCERGGSGEYQGMRAIDPVSASIPVWPAAPYRLNLPSRRFRSSSSS